MFATNWERVPSEQVGKGVERQVVWGDKSTLARISLSAGTHVSRHSHESEQLTCMVEGSMRMSLPGKDLTLRPGDIVVIPSNVEHEVWVLEDAVVIDYFSPPREDWKEGRSAYLAGE